MAPPSKFNLEEELVARARRRRSHPQAARARGSRSHLRDASDRRRCLQKASLLAGVKRTTSTSVMDATTEWLKRLMKLGDIRSSWTESRCADYDCPEVNAYDDEVS